METVQYKTGAVRSGDAEATRYDLVPLAGVRRMAEASAEGSRKYGDHNWLRGMPISVFLNHALRHIYLYLDGDNSEDHLGHAGWNIGAACVMEETRPDMQDIPTRQLTTTPPEPAHAVADGYDGWLARVPSEWGRAT